MAVYDITPKQIQQAAHRGYKRLRNFRNARLMFLRNYIGPYYDKESGEVGNEALNMIFNGIRALVPHLVMNFPKHNLTTPYLAQRQYGELLGMAVSQHDRKIDIKTSYRRVIVDALFTLGIMKTGVATSETIYDDGERIDPGTIYSCPVDFDNFIVDPNSKEHLFADACFVGDKMTVARELLLQSGLWRNDLVEKLPRVDEKADERARSLSMRSINENDNYDFDDQVEVIELWVPSAQSVIYLPGAESVEFDDFLRIESFYGLDDGPYTFLALSPPVPGNPLPVPPVGIWNDLHTLGNRMAKKIADQAMRQKDVVVYRRAGADDAQSMLDAKDGEAIASDDPDSVAVKSFGGQQNSNEVYLAQLQNWFNQMAGNPDQLQGVKEVASTATQERILAGNASVGLDDMKDLVYIFAASEGRKRAWYLDADPLMNIPLVRRVMQPPVQSIDPMSGLPTFKPPMMQDQQVILTPELRRGDFIDFTFAIEPESMGRVDSQSRLAQAMDFCVKVMPAVAAAVQALAVIGVNVSALSILSRMAKMSNIDWFDEVLADPMLQMQIMQMQAQIQQQGPQPQKGQLAQGGGPPAPNPGLGAVLQNGQPGQVMGSQPGMMEQVMSSFQDGANQGQQQLQRGY